ncbi:MAG: TIGR02147 family protein, partial [Fibrobacterota bacterium]
EKKKENNHFSHRAVLDKMGITSTGFLSNVLSGRNNLTGAQIAKLCKVLKFSNQEASYFGNLVRFNQAKSLEEKNEYFSRLTSLRKAPITLIDQKKLSFFAKWHYPVIRELIYYVPVKDDFTQLASLVNPPVKPSDAEEAVRTLEQLGFIKKNDKGYYEQSDALISTGDELKSFHVANFQLSTMERAKRALEKVPQNERDISVLTFTVSEESFHQMKTEIQQFRKRLLQIAAADQKVNQVYQCNINLFPASAPDTEDKNAPSNI